MLVKLLVKVKMLVNAIVKIVAKAIVNVLKIKKEAIILHNSTGKIKFSLHRFRK